MIFDVLENKEELVYYFMMVLAAMSIDVLIFYPACILRAETSRRNPKPETERLYDSSAPNEKTVMQRPRVVVVSITFSNTFDFDTCSWYETVLVV